MTDEGGAVARRSVLFPVGTADECAGCAEPVVEKKQAAQVLPCEHILCCLCMCDVLLLRNDAVCPSCRARVESYNAIRLVPSGRSGALKLESTQHPLEQRPEVGSVARAFLDLPEGKQEGSAVVSLMSRTSGSGGRVVVRACRLGGDAEVDAGVKDTLGALMSVLYATIFRPAHAAIAEERSLRGGVRTTWQSCSPKHSTTRACRWS
jgi:hypothetical protein